MTEYQRVMTVDGDPLVLFFTAQFFMCLLISTKCQEFIYISNLMQKYANRCNIHRIVIGDYKLHYRREIKQDRTLIHSGVEKVLGSFY